HGHCGVLDEDGEVDNDATLDLYARAAVAQAEAGADVVAPSGMMDGQVAAIRDALDEDDFPQVAILAYAAKYVSALYGPFRDAVDVTIAGGGDRKGYQQDPRNAREALEEIRADLAEGADMVMVKPALSYLDVLAAARAEVDVPLAAYHVSGEYAMVHAAAERGWLDGPAVMLEHLTAVKRAGAHLILTYAARAGAERLRSPASAGRAPAELDDQRRVVAQRLAVGGGEPLPGHVVRDGLDLDALAAAVGDLVDRARLRAVGGLAGVGQAGALEELLPDLRVGAARGVGVRVVGVQVGVAAEDDRPARAVLLDVVGEQREVLGLQPLVLGGAAGLGVQVVEVDLDAVGQLQAHDHEALHGQAVAGAAVARVGAAEAPGPRHPGVAGERHPGQDPEPVADEQGPARRVEPHRLGPGVGLRAELVGGLGPQA